MIEVALSNQQASLMVDEQRLRHAVEKVVADAGYDPVTISVAIVDDDTMHTLNRRHLDHDYPTDVLSFVLEQHGKQLDGEIIASADYAERESVEYGWSPQEELLLYVIHGALHLVGFDDQDQRSLAEMRRKERHYLCECGVPDERIPDANDDE